MTTSLADPFTLPCGLALPNRIAKAAMTDVLCDVRAQLKASKRRIRPSRERA